MILRAAVLLLALTGCATTEEEVTTRLCYLQPLGQSEQGMIVVRQFCAKEDQ